MLSANDMALLCPFFATIRRRGATNQHAGACFIQQDQFAVDGNGIAGDGSIAMVAYKGASP
jgi:hypothetical protein